jgi:hypothetical protein
LNLKTVNAISETEPARLAQWFLCEPLKRMSGLVSLPPANGLGLLVPLPWQGTDSRLCGAKTPACGGKHADDIASIGIEIKGNVLVSHPALPRAEWLAVGSACFSRRSTRWNCQPKTTLLKSNPLMKT